MRKVTLIAALVAAFIITQSNTTAVLVNDYISQYIDIASFESARSGIPVSIILAQAILESNCGNGTLAKKANNHFGVKWKSAQDGEYVYANDDDKDRYGKIVASRFVKYHSVQESFKHHSDFLMNRPNYSTLFAYDRTDYKQWALGLSRCHYATDPNYAMKLISIIEKYQLDQYDIPSVLSLEDEVETNEIHTEQTTYNTTSNQNESVELFEISQNTESPKSEMWESKTPVKANNNENELYEIIPEVSKNLKSKIQQSNVATQHVAKDKNN